MDQHILLTSLGMNTAHPTVHKARACVGVQHRQGHLQVYKTGKGMCRCTNRQGMCRCTNRQGHVQVYKTGNKTKDRV